MAVVASWDGANRLIYLLSGVTTFHPIDDIYREYRTERAANESFRVWDPFMVAIGNDPKGGGKFTSRYLSLLDGVKIVPFDEANTITVTGEVLSEDLSEPFDYSGLTNPAVVKYQPPDTEIISVGTSGLTPEEGQALIDIDANVDAMQIDVTLLYEGVYGQSVLMDSLDKTTLPGYMVMWTVPGVLIGHKEMWEAHVLAGDVANIGYTRLGKGVALEGPITAGMPPP
jgi:hypothetical protein